MKKKILIAEDEKDIANMLERSFLREGFDVAKAFDGLQAQAQIENNNPDIILLDLMMPKLSGWEVLRWLRQEKENKIPIIIISARDQMQDVKKGYQLDANHYIIKPIKVKDVIKGVKTILSMPQEDSS